jgi:hypothetical protein
VTSPDDKLSAWGAAQAAAAGPPPAFRPRRGRVWPIVTAAAAAVVLLTGGIAALVASGSDDGALPATPPSRTAPAPSPSPSPTPLPQADVPWAALPPGPLVTQSPLPRPTADTSTPRCRPTALRAEANGQGDGAGGTILRSWVLRNVGTQACLLTGQLTGVSGIRQGTREVIAVHLYGTAGFGGDVVPVALPPGQAGFAAFNFYPRCDNGPGPSTASTTYTDIRLTFEGVQLPVHGTASAIDLGCHVDAGLQVGPVGGNPPALRYADQPISHLQFSIATPATARAGQVLRYVLILTNPTDHDIALDPCPSYVQSGAGVKNHYQLNCRQAHPVAPHHSETFAMQIAIPPDTATGPTKLVWALDAVFDGRAPITAVADLTITDGTDPTVGHPACSPNATQPPCTTMELGKAYPFLLDTHCGATSLYADGKSWIPTGNQSSNSTAAGYDRPQDAGQVTLLKPTYLQYRSRQGVQSAWIPGTPTSATCPP